jgi:hypothetical protein
MKKVLFIFTLGALMSLMFMSCESTSTPSADQELAKQTEQAMQEANRETGYPAITNFQEKKVMKAIYELRDQENLICHAYFFNEIKGELGAYIGECIGYGLPYSTQFSNPEKEVYRHYESGVSSMPQPEPNGLFMPDGLSATWLLLIDPKTNEPRPVYIEPAIVVSPFKLR